MSRTGVTYDDVKRVASGLLEEGQSPTIEKLRQSLGGGSFSTLSKHLRTFRDERAKAPPKEPVEPERPPPNEVEAAVHKAWRDMQLSVKQQEEQVRTQAAQEIQAVQDAAAKAIAEAEARVDQAAAELAALGELHAQTQAALTLGIAQIQDLKVELAKTEAAKDGLKALCDEVQEQRLIERAQAKAILEEARKEAATERLRAEAQRAELGKVHQAEMALLREEAARQLLSERSSARDVEAELSGQLETTQGVLAEVRKATQAELLRMREVLAQGQAERDRVLEQGAIEKERNASLAKELRLLQRHKEQVEAERDAALKLAASAEAELAVVNDRQSQALRIETILKELLSKTIPPSQ